MNNHLDWTDRSDQNTIAEKANSLVDDIIQKIFEDKLKFQKILNLNLFELNLLYRWPIYVGVNTFIERLLRVSTNKQKRRLTNAYPLSNLTPAYFNNTVKAVQAYYYDFSLNYKLLSDISEVIAGSNNGHIPFLGDFTKPQESLGPPKQYGLNFKKVVKDIFLLCEKIYVMLIKPKIIGENSHWFRQLFFFGHSIDFYGHNFSDQNKNIDTATREDLKNICNHIFIANISGILDEMDDHQIKQLAKLFGEWIDHIIPLSINEGLNERFNYYQKMIEGWPIEQLHAFTGYYYNDNFKVSAILAKRKGAKFVVHTHGANNYSSSYKVSNELRFLDHYTTYGMNVTDNNLHNLGAKQVNFIPTGITDFYAVPRWRKSSISIKNISLLYPSGPLMDFMSDLQEISPEKNLAHRLHVLTFFDQLLKKYSGLKIIYKPFPGTYTNDPIKKQCSCFLKTGRIELTNKKPRDLYPHMNLVLWDSISTGFAESLVAGVPVIVFNSKHEYELTSPRGRIVNDALTEAGVQCFDVDSAINSFESIVHHLDRYKKETESSINMFKKDMAMPVSRREWHRRFRQGINSEKGLA